MTSKKCSKCNFIYSTLLKGCPNCKSLYNKQYRAINREKLIAYGAEWRKNNPDKYKQANKNWLENNKERAKENNSNWAKRNKDKKNLSAAEYKKRNQEKVKQKNKRHYENNKPDYFLKSTARRFALKTGGILSKGIKQKLFEIQRGLCVCCNKPLGFDFHLDHIIPLALGGKNIDSNVQLLRSECNLKKSSKDPINYMQEKGFLI